MRKLLFCCTAAMLAATTVAAETNLAPMLEAGVTEKDTAMQAIGYKEVAAALRGACSMEEAAEQIRQASRRYAKRQLSWLRGKPGIHWQIWKKETNYQEACLFSTRILEISGII